MLLDIPSAIIEKCQKVIGAEIYSTQYVAGGDINQARLLDTSIGKFFLKMNNASFAGQMFEVEARGLKILASTNAIRIPNVFAHGKSKDGAFLLMEYIVTGQKMQGFWKDFGQSLAQLHKHSTTKFGLDHENFIGSLPQKNGMHESWIEFYIQERIQPQLNLALQNNRLNSSDEKQFFKLYQRLPEICPDELPSLTHGDLWSGNFLVDTNGKPVLIDPAVSYAHREMDLAMSRLFGGFNPEFYRSYDQSFPLSPSFEHRLEIYQLYYLMVHVNLFGGGYVGSVRQILKEFV